MWWWFLSLQLCFDSSTWDFPLKLWSGHHHWDPPGCHIFNIWGGQKIGATTSSWLNDLRSVFFPLLQNKPACPLANLHTLGQQMKNNILPIKLKPTWGFVLRSGCLHISFIASSRNSICLLLLQLHYFKAKVSLQSWQGGGSSTKHIRSSWLQCLSWEILKYAGRIVAN